MVVIVSRGVAVIIVIIGKVVVLLVRVVIMVGHDGCSCFNFDDGNFSGRCISGSFSK